MPNGTYGGVRGRRLITASYSIEGFLLVSGSYNSDMDEKLVFSRILFAHKHQRKVCENINHRMQREELLPV